ncbi:MAG: EAL domain-containing protein [Pseudomonadota bacterium]
MTLTAGLAPRVLTRLIAMVMLIVLGVGAFVSHQTLPLIGLQNALVSMRFAMVPRKASGEVVVIGIDKASLEHIGTWPWKRGVYSDIIDRLLDARAAEIAFDIDFSSPSDPIEDAKFALALGRAGGSVILAAFEQANSIERMDAGISLNQPIKELLRNAWPASVNVLADSDGRVRSMPVTQSDGQNVLPSLVSLLAGGIDLQRQSILIDYSIKPTSLPIYSIKALLEGRIAPQKLAGKRVIIGAMAVELRDSFSVPVHGVLPGSIVQAMAADGLVQRRILTKTEPMTLAGLLVLVLTLTGVMCMFVGLMGRLVLCALSMIALETVAILVQGANSIVLNTAPAHLALLGFALFLAGQELAQRRNRIKKVRAQKRELERVFAHAINDNFDAILVFGADEQILYENAMARDLLNFTPSQKTGAPEISSYLSQAVLSDVRRMLQGLVDGIPQLPLEGVMRTTRATGESIEVQYRLTPNSARPSRGLQDELKSDRAVSDNPVLCFTGKDVTWELANRREIEHLARFDVQSGAANRFSLLERAEDLFKPVSEDENEADSENSGGISVFAFKLQGLDMVRDMFGMELADQLLRALVKRVSGFTSDNTMVSRLTGTRFAVLFPSAFNGVDAEAIAQDLVRLIARPVDVKGQQITISANVGYALHSQRHASAEAMVNAAEMATRQAELKNRTNIALFDEAQAERLHRAHAVENALRSALSEREFEVVYQPQIDMESGNFLGAEALIRWHSAKLGLVPPDEFIPLAESNGSIVALGRFVLEEACRAATGWRADATVSINVSPIQLGTRGFARLVDQTLKSHGLTAQRLVVELTETAMVENRETCLDELSALRAMGVQVAIDDFGTGYSSMQYLTDLPFDVLKIDRAFVAELDRGGSALPVIKSIVALAEGLGAKTCCEGIETQEHHEMIRATGCSSGQGYFYARPVSLAGLNALDDAFRASRADLTRPKVVAHA